MSTVCQALACTRTLWIPWSLVSQTVLWQTDFGFVVCQGGLGHNGEGLSSRFRRLDSLTDCKKKKEKEKKERNRAGHGCEALGVASQSCEVTCLIRNVLDQSRDSLRVVLFQEALLFWVWCDFFFFWITTWNVNYPKINHRLSSFQRCGHGAGRHAPKCEMRNIYMYIYMPASLETRSVEVHV